ncbi:MAG: DUF1592 domain-containing protein [Candidatus Binatia bacterium]|nr:DUF1592 domain-containing protein [Candidatus Binatia bacterium]
MTYGRAAHATVLVLLLALASACGDSTSSSSGGAPPTGPVPGPMPTNEPGPPPLPLPPTDPPTEPGSALGGPIAMRRLTQAQYRASILDVLGDDLVLAGRIEPDARRDGLLAIGATFVGLTASGLEGYDSIARNVAAQVVDAGRRGTNVPCTPESATGVDDGCAAQFIAQVGRRLFRRPLDEDEVTARVAVARDAAADLADFYGGLEVALSTLLVSPEFLFRIELDEAAATAGGRRLTSLSVASRLSYFLWNTTPDEELLAAAEAGDLTDDAGLATQVDRMLGSPRLEDSVRALFSDMYGLDLIEQGLVRKDPAIFPAFSQAVMQDAREQTLRVIVEHLLEEERDYRELFITRNSFMTRALGLVYRVPAASPDGWEPYVFADDSRRAGLLTQVSLLALHSHPGRSSPTLRGKFIREVLLCQDVPPPPGDLDFSLFADEAALSSSTARQRLEAHQANLACAGCHSLMDPLGLALENLDGLGIERDTENGEVIDASGELGGNAFDGPPGLGVALASDPALSECFVRTLYRYATGRDVAAEEDELLDFLTHSFAHSGYRLRDLLREIALSEGFRTTEGPRAAEEDQP